MRPKLRPPPILIPSFHFEYSRLRSGAIVSNRHKPKDRTVVITTVVTTWPLNLSFFDLYTFNEWSTIYLLYVLWTIEIIDAHNFNWPRKTHYFIVNYLKNATSKLALVHKLTRISRQYFWDHLAQKTRPNKCSAVLGEFLLNGVAGFTDCTVIKSTVKKIGNANTEELSHQTA